MRLADARCAMKASTTVAAACCCSAAGKIRRVQNDSWLVGWFQISYVAVFHASAAEHADIKVLRMQRMHS